MADRDALLRDAQRKMQAQIRERTPSDFAAWAGLDAFFEPVAQTLEEAVRGFVPLLQALRGQNDYVRSWRVVRSAEDDADATGLDVIADPDGYARFLRESRNNSDASQYLDVLGFSDRINPDDPRRYSAQITYAGSPRPAGSDRVRFIASPGSVAPVIGFDRWVAMVETMVTWRKARYVAVGHPVFGIHYRVYEHREWMGYMGWFPQQIAAADLPDFAILRPIGDGTLVATQAAPFGSDDADALDRSAQLEMALADLGVLPTGQALK